MDYSSSNTGLWNIVVQIGLIAGIILLSTFLKSRIKFIKNSLMPTAVMTGFLLLILRSADILSIDVNMLEKITYHGLALGFIALTLRTAKDDGKAEGKEMIVAKSGALIVSAYLMQGILGLIISLSLAYTIMPDLFHASGILLPMAYGQGPGQANNVGTTYEALGFIGGRSFGLSLSAAGYLCACVVGVIYINVLARKGKLKRIQTDIVSGSVTVDTFQDKDEIPIAESIDKLSLQVAMVLVIYLFTYLACDGLVRLTGLIAPGAVAMASPLIWGFNFIVGAVLAILFRTILKKLKNRKRMTHQYQNNYLLSRISGLAFDLMIAAGIASINFEDLSGLWLPFIIMAVAGGVVTLVYLELICKKLYPRYHIAAFTSMYGMLTGTLSSGILLLREVDPSFETPAANNLVMGSSVAILFGVPVLFLISLAPTAPFLTLGISAVYLALMLLFMFMVKRNKAKK